MKIHATRTGDVELWRLTHGHTWSVPFYCEPCCLDAGDRMMACYPAVPIEKSPIAAQVQHMLSSHQFAERGYYRLFRWDTFSKLFIKCPGITPDMYFWEKVTDSGKMPNMRPIEDDVKEPDFSDEFIESVWRRTLIVDKATFKLVYRCIIQEIGHYLLHKMKPVDLGWFVVGAVPLRVNWKQAVLTKFPYLLNLLPEMKDPSMFYAKEEKVMGMIHSFSMMSVAPSTKKKSNPHIWNWNLEVIPKPQWEEYSRETEKARLAHYPEHLYVSAWASIIKKVWPFMFGSMRSFITKTLDPNAVLVKRSPGGCNVLVPRASADAVPQKEHDHREFRLVSSNGYLPTDDPPFDDDVPEKAKGVPPVPPVP
jgi:hypothetical protein